jgi:hypothetical protein
MGQSDVSAEVHLLDHPEPRRRTTGSSEDRPSSSAPLAAERKFIADPEHHL